MSSHGSGHRSLSALPVVLCAVLLVATSLGAGAQSSFIGLLGLGPSVSTVPNNGDVNPYGMALVQETKGSLIKGDILISNFNNSANLQGTGTTIMEISPQGAVQTFAQIDATKVPGGMPWGSWFNDRAGRPAHGMGHRG